MESSKHDWTLSGTATSVQFFSFQMKNQFPLSWIRECFCGWRILLFFSSFRIVLSVVSSNTNASTKGVFTSGNSRRCEFDIGMTLWFHTVFTWMDTFCRPTCFWSHIELNIEDCACAIRSRLPGEWFQAAANGHTAFTWHRNEFSYRNENLAPVRLPGWTRTGMTRFGTRFYADIMQTNYRATGGNWNELVPEWRSRRCHVNTP